MAIRKTKLNRGLLFFSLIQNENNVSQITWRCVSLFNSKLILRFCANVKGAKKKRKKPTNICIIALQLIMTQRAKSIKKQTTRVELCSRQDAKTIFYYFFLHFLCPDVDGTLSIFPNLHYFGNFVCRPNRGMASLPFSRAPGLKPKKIFVSLYFNF